MGIVLRDAVLLDLDPVSVERADLRVDGGKIVERGRVAPKAGDEVVDCGGAVVMPGLVNGHTHLYSALAVGMPGPSRTPSNFHEILKWVWWRLDRALDAEANEMSAVIGALDAVHCGTTTLIDHHASPSAIEGSLDRIESGIDRVGLRGVLCYEVTDRNGVDGMKMGVDENRRYVSRKHGRDARATTTRFAGLVGAHAGFTLSDESVAQVTGLAKELGVGVHIHVAEDRCDDEICRRQFGAGAMERLERHGLLVPSSIFAHGIHLSDDSIDKVNRAGITMAHNTRSNMNNAVGYAPIGKLAVPVMLGTDGIGADMFAEAKTAWFKARDGGAGISPADVVAMLAASARRASKELGVVLGKLAVGAEADIVVTDYVPFTPMDSTSAIGHLIFAMAARDVRDVMVAGNWVLRGRKTVKVDEGDVRSRSRKVATKVWERMAAIPL